MDMTYQKVNRMENVAKCSLLKYKNEIRVGGNNRETFMNSKSLSTTSEENLEINIHNIKKIWVLKKVLELGSLKKASQSLKITPSAVSQNLKMLKVACKQSLLTYNKNGTISPTPKANELIEKCEEIFKAFDAANIEIKNKPRIDYLDLGFYEALSHGLASNFSHHLKKLFPSLQVRIYCNKNYQLLKHLRQGHICSAVLVAEPYMIEDFYSQAIFESEMGFYTTFQGSATYKNLEEALDSKINLAMLSTGEEGVSLYMSHFLKQFSFKAPIDFTADNYGLLYEITKKGNVLCLLPKYIGGKTDLVELKSKKLLKENGKHTVYLVSEKHCDRNEADFLAQELRLVFLSSN